MDISNIKLFSMMKHKISYMNEKQAVLAENVANADTPGYKSKDLKKLNFNDIVQNSSTNISAKTTNSRHISSSSKGEASFQVELSGKNVAIEDQMLKMAENSIDYQATTSVYKKMAELMKLSLGGGGR